MGYALAEAAARRGADVVLVTGPSELPLPYGVVAHRIETTADLLTALESLVKQADALLMAAAPADFRPRTTAKGKQPRSAGALGIERAPTPHTLPPLQTPAHGLRR